MSTWVTRLAFLLACPALALAASPLQAGVQLPGGATIEQVDFERHVMGLLGRMGCATGSCHGSFQGKGGMQLSLFGYDPARDYQVLVRDGNGRRLNLTSPDDSLLLLKATGQPHHGGFTRFSKNSWQYRLLREWIVQGAQWKPGSGTLTKLEITPAEQAFTRPGETRRLQVNATFADGSREDITSLCDFRTNDDAVAEVTNLGAIRALRPGDTAVIVSYRGSVVPVRVMVPAVTPPNFVYPKVPEVNYIDREVFAKLRRLNIAPSPLSTDEEFLRRVTLDTTGALPTPAEVRQFLADRSPSKREKKIDELLAHPRHAALWATKFSDITGNNTDGLENPPQRKTYLSQMWHDWFRKRIAENRPYDQIVKGVLTATSREGASLEEYIKQIEKFEEAQDKGEKTSYADRDSLDLFWRRQNRIPNEEWGEKTAAAFLGVRLECAQCHKHPFDRWTQADYRAYANVFASLNIGVPPDSAKSYREANQERQKRSQQRINELRRKGVKVNTLPVAPLREVFIGRTDRPLLHPDTNKPLPAQTLGGPEIKVKTGEDPRQVLWQWMREPNNPFFARSFVNRVWGHYFGIGIVHPVDDFSLANPPSNEKLLDALARDFVASGYNIRQLEKRILLSRTYQLSSTPNETNKFDKNNFARGYIRPLMAEVVVDMLNDALGVTEKWGQGEGTATARALEVGASRVQNPSVNYVFRVFGRPPRTSACDCERAMDPALPQKLFLLADPNLQQKLRTPGNRLATLIEEKADDGEALEELFLATLSRKPTEAEKKNFLDYRERKKQAAASSTANKRGKVVFDRRALFTDTLWALINTTEFIFNH
ncbi:MAG: DUF1549 and DUF1553 domain-containing protein [Gemmataceae bacterium]